MKRLTLAPAMFLIALLTLAACAPARFQDERSEAPSSRAVESKAAEAAKPASPALSAPAAGGAAPAIAPAPAPAPQARPPAERAAAQTQVDAGQRLIVRNATLVLTVEDVTARTVQVAQLATSLGGWVVSSNAREEGGRTVASIVLRVPEKRLDEALGQLKKDVVKVNSEQVTSRDVTEEYVDTNAQFRNLRATEERYLELLKRANTVQEILQIEQQLTNVRGQIERLQARLQFLERSAETSAITVELRPHVVSQQSWLEDWNLLPVVRSAIVGLINTVQFALAMLIWVVVFLPIWLPLLWLLRRRFGRRTPRATATT